MSRPKVHTAARVATAIRLPAALHERLAAAAEERGLSANYLVNVAVEELLDNLIPVADLRLTRPRDER